MISLREAFSKEYLQRLDSYQRLLAGSFGAGFMGKRKSHAKGSSLEFSDFKNYTAGDDLRRVDWNSYARSEKIFIKLFMEERQSQFNIFLDTSLSMSFYGKGFFSMHFAGSLAYVAMRNFDNVNVYALGPGSRSASENNANPQSFVHLLNFFDTLAYGGGTDLLKSVEQAWAKPSMAGTSIVFSDFFDSGDSSGLIKYLQGKRQNVIIVHVMGMEEINPSYGPQVRLRDSENNHYLDLEITPGILEKYSLHVEQFKSKLQKTCHARGAAYLFASTDHNILELLQCV